MTNAQDSAPHRRRLRRALAARIAERQDGVVSRSQLYAAGVTRGEVRANVRADRWCLLGRHCIGMFTGPLPETACYWRAVLEGGPRAYVDGESSLIVAGLSNYTARLMRITVPRGARIRHRGTDVDIRQTRRWRLDDLDEHSPLPRSRNAVAAVRAALWAKSDRQAALLLTMTAQQELASAEEMGHEMLRIKRDKRRGFLHAIILDLLGGVRSLGELDVVQGCRDRGLPEPDSQVLWRTKNGNYYLDFRWKSHGVVLEVDGIQHILAEQVVADALRHNSIALSGDIVLRLPLLGLRLEPNAFFDQLRTALIDAGWRPLAAAA